MLDSSKLVTIATIQHYPATPTQPRVLERAEHPVSRRDIDPRVLKVLYRLINAGHTAYLVGGGVRDLMMQRRPKDFDVATSAHPQQVRDLFRNSRLIGRRFRLVHVFFGPHNIEVATFRRRAEDVEPEEPLIRHDNTFGTAEEDAFRRDFTVNALFYDPQSFHVIDYVGGVADLETRLIRTIGDPALRMREDPVRMLRAVRFASKLGFEIEPATRAAIERHRTDLLKASVPRLVEEIYRAFGIAAAGRAIELMYDLGLLEVLLPPLADFLRADATPPALSATAQNLAAMGRHISAGTEPTHALVLACLFADLRLSGMPAGQQFDLVTDLRMRGFARGDTERMRLIFEALPHLLTPGRRTRRLIQRPYFPEARLVHEIVAPGQGVDSATLAAFLCSPDAFLTAHGTEQRHGAQRRHQSGEPSTAGTRRRRRGRRGRRGGRARHRRNVGDAAATRNEDGSISTVRIASLSDTGASPETQAAYSTSGEPSGDPKFCEPCEPQGD